MQAGPGSAALGQQEPLVQTQESRSAHAYAPSFLSLPWRLRATDTLGAQGRAQFPGVRMIFLQLASPGNSQNPANPSPACLPSPL